MVETRPYPAAREILAALKTAGWRLAVCTNKPEAPSREILEALGLAPLFEALAGGDSFPVRKPHPDHLLRLLRAMGADPATAVMLGDSGADAAAAKAAGLPAVMVRFGYGRGRIEDYGADALIDRFEELPAALRRLAARARRTAP